MKKLLLLLVLVALSVSLVTAQDAVDCSADGIEDAIDDLYATYLGSRDDGITNAAQALADGIGTLISNCENASADDTTTETTELPLDTVIIPGQWYVTWAENDEYCGDIHITGTNRPFIMELNDIGGFTAVDRYAWPPLEFQPTRGEDVFTFDRNAANGDFTYRYDVTVVSPSELTGVITNFFANGCSLSGDFTMQLQDADVQCMVNTQTGGNLRSGPGTSFNRAGQMPTIFLQPVIGQANDTAGFVWWQLADETWIRSDIVQEAGDCESVPVVED